jgi:uridine kinase
MEQSISIRCTNNGKTLAAPMGSSLKDVYRLAQLQMEFPPVCARVNNKVEGMDFRFYNNKTVEFLDIRSASGMRNYTRTLFFVLCKAVEDICPGTLVQIDIPVSNGYYVDMDRDVPIDDIRRRMQEIIDADIPIHRHQVPTEEAVEMFDRLGDKAKAKLLRSSGRMYTVYYSIERYVDFFYGSLLTHTSQLYLFGLEKYNNGLLLRIPSRKDPTRLGEHIRQDKMFDIFREYHNWQKILGVRTVGDFNEAVAKGHANNLIQVGEALQEKKIANIAFDIAGHINPSLVPEKFRKEFAETPIRMVLIAGPSSSGKTTTCKRLSIQLLTNGIKPIPISLDDYFVDRDNTPRDETGDFDFESIYALNLPLLNQQLQDLLDGKEVELPRYDFKLGKSVKSGKKLKLHDNEVLVVEGIHALNPELTAKIPERMKYRVYASALTTIMLDDHNYIPATDNRLLRRIVRDYNYRGVSAQETIRRWPSVRRGEDKWIFPYQENANAMFNTAMLFELAILKIYAIPLLEQVPEDCKEYSEAYRLRKFLGYFKPLPFDTIPPTSLLREFLGGSSFEY